MAEDARVGPPGAAPALPPATAPPRSPLLGDAPWRLRLPWLIRTANRLRLLAKLRQVRLAGGSWRRTPRALAAYVLLDPEVGDWSYPLGNAEEHVLTATRLLGVPDERALAHLAELDGDPVLERALQRRVRRRFDMKRRYAYGNRALWWVLVRERRPGLVVETGVRHGFGSAVVLRALQRNARDGHEGRLVSFDVDPVSGWMVAPVLRDRWERRIGDGAAGLAALGAAGRRVDLTIHDSSPELVVAEARAAIAASAPGGLVLYGTWGKPGGPLRALADEVPGAAYAAIAEDSRHPLTTSGGFELIRLPG